MPERVRQLLLPALVYALVAVLLTWPLVTDLGGVVVGGPRTDVWNSLWGFWFAAGPGAPWPSDTGLLDFPQGGRIALADPLNAALALPLTRLWGPVVAYGLVVLGHLWGGGLAAHALGRACGGGGWIAGLGYVLAPTCIAHLQNGSSEAVSLLWLPLACLALVRTLESPYALTAMLWSIPTGAAMVLAALGGWYAGIGAWVFAGALAVGGWRGIPASRRHTRLFLPLFYALAITFPLASEIRKVALADDGLVDIKRVEDLARIRRTLGSADPRVFFAPGDFRSPDFQTLLGNPSDYVHTTYLGFALLGLGIWASWRRRRGAAAPGEAQEHAASGEARKTAVGGRERAWWLALVGGALLALGPVVVIDGMPLSMGARGVSLPLPYLALEPLPGLGSLSLLWRLATVSALALAVLADRNKPVLFGLVVLELLLISPVRGLPEVTALPETAALEALASAPEGAVLNLPPTASRTYLFDQTVHGKPTVGSLNTGINRTGLEVTTAARYLRDGAIDVGGLVGTAREAGVRYVIVHKDQLMEDHYVEAAVAIRRNTTLLAEDGRMRVFALY